MNNGWVKLHRQILENEFLAHDNNAFMVFTKLLLLANKKNGRYITGRYRFAEIVNLNPSTARDVLIRLCNEGLTTQSSDRQKTVITICKWKQYQQQDDSVDDNQTTTRRQPDDTKQELRIKNNSTNVLLAKPGNAEINKMFDYWQNKVGYPITSKTTQNRRAAYNLQRKYKDDVYKLIDGVAMAQGERFAPQISDFAELQAKLNNLLAWGKKRTGDRMEIIA